MKTPQQKNNQRLIVLIFALSVIPFLMAWYLKENPELLAARTNNNGALITPPITTELSDFVGFDQFSRDNMKELAGHWVMINVIPKAECAAVCSKALHDTKQLLLMMGKDLVRIRRIAVLLNEVEPNVATTWWQDDTRLLKANANAALLQKIHTLQKSNPPDGLLILMDPLGNLMMHYAPGFDPYKVMVDLKKLLAVSQIG
ncbi:MAG: hypothetical protein HOP02_07045 [Methylococcaceae bacterium]|nr:hypothetical protein [Methylococcaceae bacterium]